MYKSLVTDEWEAFNEDGKALAMEIGLAVMPILRKYCTNGYKTTDMQYIVESTVNGICAELRLRRSFEKSKNQKTSLDTSTPPSESLEQFICPKCRRVQSFTALELRDIGDPFCSVCEEVEMEVLG